MQKSGKFYFGVMVIFLILVSSVVYADDKKVQAVFTTWEPYGYVEGGKAVGFELEIFAAVMKKINIQTEFINQPWKRCLASVEHGNADAVISALKTTEREAYMYFPREHISVNESALFTKTGNKIEFNGSYEGLKDYLIGVTSGFSYGSAFDAADFLKKDPATKTEAVVTKVLMGRNELGVGNIAVISSILLKKGERDKIRFLKPLVHSQKLYAGFSKAKGPRKLTDDFSKALSEFKKSDEYKSILQKYGVE